MKMMAIIAGVIAGGIGAAVWCAIAYYANFEIGWVAWAVGAFVGLAVCVASRGEADDASGAVAAIIAVCAVCGGKFGAVHLYVDKHLTNSLASVHVTDEQAQLKIADTLVYEYSGASKPLKWPAGMDAQQAKKPVDFPKDLWADVLKRWKAKGSEGQASFRQSMEDEQTADLRVLHAQAEKAAFWGSFGIFDALWFFLAIGSAYKIGSASGGSDD